MTEMTLVVRAPFALIGGEVRPAAVAVAGERIVDIADFNDEFNALADITLNDNEVLVLADSSHSTNAPSGRGIRVGAPADLVAWGRSTTEAAVNVPVPGGNFAVPAT